jgi:hypothetical protein
MDDDHAAVVVKFGTDMVQPLFAIFTAPFHRPSIDFGLLERNAFAVLRNISFDLSIGQILAQMGGIAVLVAVVCKTTTWIPSAGSSEQRAAPAAVSVSMETQEIALGCLAELAACAPLKPLIIQAHVVEACIGALKVSTGHMQGARDEARGHMAVHVAAVAVLFDLSTGSTQSSLHIGVAGGCRALVALLVHYAPSNAASGGSSTASRSSAQQSCVNEVQDLHERASAALVQLAMHPANAHQLRQGNALHALSGCWMASENAHAQTTRLVQLLLDPAPPLLLAAPAPAGEAAKRQRR